MLDDLAAGISPDPLLDDLASARARHDAVTTVGLLRDIGRPRSDPACQFNGTGKSCAALN
ncbi:hypothetical protein EJC51_01245 [Streptomyces aquilus]|uniref:Uncharacterized protein n=1 Tax=Streptomyces aquilus TaxID=2548456 RepID=A0A3Q9BUR6_9ACTN|nr:hypothetical protein [Streptomyces aquilus]AZP14894.1 hypothetical protein EJC51_01245 [Streptomyces aquilus]